MIIEESELIEYYVNANYITNYINYVKCSLRLCGNCNYLYE